MTKERFIELLRDVANDFGDTISMDDEKKCSMIIGCII